MPTVQNVDTCVRNIQEKEAVKPFHGTCQITRLFALFFQSIWLKINSVLHSKVDFRASKRTLYSLNQFAFKSENLLHRNVHRF